MKKDITARVFTVVLFLCSYAISAVANPLVVENFDAVEIGTKWKMWDRWNNPVSSTAEVIADPANPSNHVLKVTVKGWNCFPEFSVPEEYKGAKIKERFATIRFRFYRPSSDTNDYKQMHVFYGSDVQYDDNGGYPYQGDRNQWQWRSYDIINVPDASTATALHLGIHCDVSEYYIDDIMLYGEYDDYTTYESGVLDICTKNTSSTYTVYTTKTFIPEGKSLNAFVSRYTDFNADFAGSGTLNFYGGGERCYLGEHSGKKYPDWKRFTGDVNIYKYNKVETGAGFYGVVMTHNGKTFSVEDVDDGIQSGKVCNMLANNNVTLKNGAAIAFESGSRAAQFGTLNTEAGSRIYGYYKASASHSSYLIVGGNNTDATMAGRIAPMESSGTPYLSMSLGIIKDGRGTYTLTANDNCITGAIRVRNGRVNICNDVVAAEKGKLSGGTGTPASGKPAAYVFGNGVLGGTGNIAAPVEVYGTLEPGTSEPGILRIKDYSKNSTAKVVMHPEGVLRFKIKNTDSYDQLIVSNGIERSAVMEDFSTSQSMPTIKVSLTDDCEINAGDMFTVITAKERTGAETWKWNVVFPKKYTWKADEIRNLDGTYGLRLTVVSLEDDANNTGDEEEKEEDEGEENIPETFGDDGDVKTLRQYADEKGLRIGVAVPTYTIPMDNVSDARTTLVKDEFNMVVNENELKWDSCEPERGVFNFGGGDALLSFAINNNMYMRGHTLAWHSQVAQWVSADGKKNDKGWTKRQLLDILKEHIFAVVGHYKGRIGEWDVVNECLDDDQSIVRTNPEGYTLRKQSVWTTVIGEEFIDSAFVWAHQADPQAKLYLNDYSQETQGKAKTEAFYNLAKRLKKDGRPIDGVGFQCHLDAGQVNVGAIGKNIARYAELGLECAITELDLGIDMNTELDRQQQAKDYYRIVSEAMKYDHCRSVLIWGLYDAISWRQSYPLLWNNGLAKKPAYYAVRMALANADNNKEVEGDVDGDGSVTMTDANMVVNTFLSGTADDAMKKKCDVDKDGTVSMSDANAVVNIYLSVSDK